MDSAHCCFECGYRFADKWDAIDLIKKKLKEKNINNIKVIFDLFHIKKYCCRTHIITQIDLLDLMNFKF